MDELKELQAKIRVLEDIEAIKKLKARYWLCVDKKLWDELGNCFTEDVVVNMPSKKFSGKRDFVQSLSRMLSEVITVHQGHHCDIEILSETTAKGTWAMYDNLQNTETNSIMEGYGFYEDDYVKENGSWKIKTTKVTRLFVKTQNIAVGTQPNTFITRK